MPSSADETGGPSLSFDVGAPFDAPDAPELPEPSAPGGDDGGPAWNESVIRQALEAQGQAVHGLLAVDPDGTEWEYTRGELQTIAPALTRILNRYRPTRAAASAGDELTLALAFGGHVARSLKERRLAVGQLIAEQQHEQQAAEYVPPAAGPQTAAEGLSVDVNGQFIQNGVPIPPPNLGGR